MEVYVVLERILHQVDVIVVREEVLTATTKHTFFVCNIHIEEVSNLGRTPTNVHVSTLVPSSFFEDFFIPIYIRVDIRVFPLTYTIDEVLCV